MFFHRDVLSGFAKVDDSCGIAKMCNTDITKVRYSIYFALTVDRWKIVIFVRFLVVISGPGASVKIRAFRVLLTVVDRAEQELVSR